MYVKKSVILEEEDIQAIKKVSQIASELLKMSYQHECDIDEQVLDNFLDTLYELEYQLFGIEDWEN